MNPFRAVMKAICINKFGGPEVLSLQNITVPAPKAAEVLIRVKAAGVNPKDTYERAGNYGPKDFPFIPGGDAAGIVEIVGEGVSNVKVTASLLPEVLYVPSQYGPRLTVAVRKLYKAFTDRTSGHITLMQVGDRVFCNGAGSYAEYMVAHSGKVFRLPDRLSFSQGAAIPVPYFTALRALKYRANAKAGETVLIHGASGGTGIAACQIASAMKLLITGTASTEAGSELVKRNGANTVLNHKDANHANNLKSATNGRGFDVILEMLANVNLATDLEVVAEHGRIIVIGSRGKIELDPRLLMRNESLCTGVFLMKATEEEWREMGAEILRGVEGNWINPIVAQELPLSAAAEAHQSVIEHASGAQGKIVLLVD